MSPPYIKLPDGFVIESAEAAGPIAHWIVWNACVSTENAPSPYDRALPAVLRGRSANVMIMVSNDGRKKVVDFPPSAHRILVMGFTPMHAEYNVIQELKKPQGKATRI